MMGHKLASSNRDIFEFRRRLAKEGSEFIRMLQYGHRFKGTQKKIGAELELNLVDRSTLRAVCISPEVVKKAAEADYKCIGPELSTFNIELNAPPISIRDGKDKDPLSQLHSSLSTQVGLLRAIAGGNIIPVMHGIWPMIQREDINIRNIYPNPRYRLLHDNCHRSRGGTHRLVINEGERVSIRRLTFMHEAMNTSFQLHLSDDLANIPDIFNMAMLAIPIVLSLSANSPLVFGRHVNDESRIIMLEKSVDFRTKAQVDLRLKRAMFPAAFLDRASEWFLSAMMEEPVLPVIEDTGSYIRPKDCELFNRLPDFRHFFLHLSTVWHWIRPKVYAMRDGSFSMGVEIRPLPSGPTFSDMVANAALCYGLIHHFIGSGVPQKIKQMDYGEESRFVVDLYDNFYSVTKNSINEKIFWPTGKGFEKFQVWEIGGEILEGAARGLRMMHIPEDTISKYLGIISARIEARENPATAQMRLIHRLEREHGRPSAVMKMCEAYISIQESDVPFVQAV